MKSAGLLFFPAHGIYVAMEITPAQCRAARALIDITQDRAAELSGVSKRTIASFETGQRTPIATVLRAICRALEEAGVEFTNGDEPGVKLKSRGRKRRS